jgi:hypothetical protein
MSIAQIKKHVAGLTIEERLDLAAWIAHLNQAADPEYQAELDRRMMAMDAGQKFTQSDLKRAHKELVAKGH